MSDSYSAAYADDPSGSYTTRHSLGAYRTSELMTTGNFLRFVGIPTFLKAPLLEQSKEAKYGLVGIPYDGGVVRTPGARFGPRGIRAACWRAPDYHPQFDIALTECKTLVDCGDMQISPMSVADSLQTIDNCISSLLERGILPISVGGDHGITYPILRAINRMHGAVAVVHFDAHCDMQRGGFTHGTMFRYAVEEGLVSPGDFIQVGIRKIYGDDRFNFHRQHGIEVILADELDSLSETDLAQRFARLKGKKVYVTYDMDFVDQAHAPGTGSPEAGGPTSTMALACVRALRGLDIVGMDLTEVAPVYDVREMTCYLANLILFEMVAVLLDAERSNRVSPNAKAQ